jgi:hypothetical protein
MGDVIMLGIMRRARIEFEDRTDKPFPMHGAIVRRALDLRCTVSPVSTVRTYYIIC